MAGTEPIFTKQITRNTDRVTGLFHAPFDSPWFVGHFPSHPILPAIALIDLVARILDKREGRDGTALNMQQLKRVRFRQIVRPGEDVLVDLMPDKKTGEGRYRFKISSPDKAEKAVADGLVLTVDPEIAPVSPFALQEKDAGGRILDIEKYLPHRDRIKLVDGVVVQEGAEQKGGATREKDGGVLQEGGKQKGVVARVKETWPLYHPDKGVNPIVIVELVAQATAVMMGQEEEDSDKGNMNLGYIVGIKKAK